VIAANIPTDAKIEPTDQRISSLYVGHAGGAKGLEDLKLHGDSKCRTA